MKRIAFSLALVTFAALAFSGCGVWDNIFGSGQKATVIDGIVLCDANGDGQDDRPADLRQAVLAATCPSGNSAECPTGSYCDSGSCVFDCASDLKCGSGQVCNCRGKCETGSSTNPPSPVAGSCPVDPVLVQSILSPAACTKANEANDCPLGAGCNEATGKCAPRRCAWDDECPFGSNCNRASGTCVAQCLDPGTPCGEPGKVCDCRGMCVGPEDASVRPARRSLTLDYAPPVITIAGERASAWSRQVAVRVRLPVESGDLLTGDGLTRTMVVPVEVKAGANLLVACSSAEPTAASYKESCSLTGSAVMGTQWAFGVSNKEWVAEELFWVKSKGLAADVPEGWQVRLSSPAVAGSARFLSVKFDAPLTSGSGVLEDVPATWTGETRYTGTVSLRAPIDSMGLGDGQRFPDLSLNVQASLLANCGDGAGACLLINDPSSTLAKSGQLIVPLDKDSAFSQEFLKSPKAVSDTSQEHESLVATARLVSMQQHVETKALIGSFEIVSGIKPPTGGAFQSPFYLQGSFTGSPVAAVCTNAKQCPTGWSCQTGQCAQCTSDTQCGTEGACVHSFCVSKSDYQSKSFVGALGSNLRSDFTDWRALMADVANTSFEVEGNLASSNLYESLMTRSDIGAFSAHPISLFSLPDYVPYFAGYKLGQSLEVTFGNVRAAVRQSWGSGAQLSLYSDFTPADLCSPFQVIGQTRCFPNLIWGDFNTIACLDDVPSQISSTSVGGGVLKTLPVAVGVVPYCRQLYANMKRSGKGEGLPPSFKDHCYPAGKHVRVTYASAQDEYAVWDCPKWIVALKGDGGEECYAPTTDSSTGDIPFASKAFGDEASGVLPRSGDLSCAKKVPQGASLVYDGDRPDGPTGASDMLRTCLTELDRGRLATTLSLWNQTKASLGSSAPTAATVAKIQAALVTALNGDDCFNPARFFSSLEHGTWRWRSRLLAQWITIHSFIATQAFEEFKLTQTDSERKSVPGTTEPPATPIAPLPEIIAKLNYSWSLVFESLQALRSAPASEIRDPDYRTTFNADLVAKPEDEQPDGFMPAAIQGLTAYLKLVDTYLEDAQFESYAQMVDNGVPPDGLRTARRVAGEALRFAIAIEGQLKGVFDNASAPVDVTTAEGTAVKVKAPLASTAWYEAFAGSLKPYLEARAALAFRASTDMNPLGITENDVPLFFGDLNGTNSRFFAASDYILNTWATSAVGSAQAALENARTAWMSRRNATIQDEDRKNDRSRLFEGIWRRYGEQVEQLCGFPATGNPWTRMMALSDADVNTCFLREERPECAGVTKCFKDPSDISCLKRQCDQVFAGGDEGVSEAWKAVCVAAKDEDEMTDGDGGNGGTGTVVKGLPGNSADVCPNSMSSGPTADPVERCKEDLFKKEWNKILERNHYYTSAVENGIVEQKKPLARVKRVSNGKLDSFKDSKEFRVGDWARFGEKANQACRQFYKKYDQACMGDVELTIHYGDGALAFEKEADPWYLWVKERETKKVRLSYNPVKDGNGALKDKYMRDCTASDRIWLSRTGNTAEYNEEGCGESLCIQDEIDKAVKCWKPWVSDIVCSREQYDSEVRQLLVKSLGEWTGATAARINNKCESQFGSMAGAGQESRNPDAAGPLPFPASCYSGELGAAAIAAHAARQDVSLAWSAWNDAQEIYDISGRVCSKFKQNEATVRDYEQDFIEEMKALGRAKTAVDAIQEAAKTFKLGDPGTWVGAGAAAGATALQGELTTRMTEASNEHAAFIRKIGAEEKILSCFADLEKQRATFDTQRESIVRRYTDLASAAQRYNELVQTVRRQIANAKDTHRREMNRKWSSYAHSYWFEEKADRFLNEFRWAQRLVFLAMRAIEYEFQQSFDLRQQILSASHPDQLEQAVRTMQQEVATRSINRRRPEELSTVLSLRDDVLGLRDRRDAPSGERAFSAATRFKGRLWDPQYAVYDKAGKWIGQGVPFNMNQFGTLKNRCAERMWRVTATVQGDGLSDREPGTPLMLLKKNTFASQWCEGRGDGTPYQVGHIQPSRNLFRDKNQGGSAGETDQFSVASIYPFFNVRRADFFKDQFQEGGSEELAGRGLYGDYVLLFPAEMLMGERLSQPAAGTLGKVENPKFPLERVEDVLIRFDYLSVDNFDGVAQVGR